MSVVYEKRFHVNGDLSRPLTKEGNDKVLGELLSQPVAKRVCVRAAVRFEEWQKEYKTSFATMTDDEKKSWILCLKVWFKDLKAMMANHRIGKENFRYGASWNMITKFVYQF